MVGTRDKSGKLIGGRGLAPATGNLRLFVTINDQLKASLTAAVGKATIFDGRDNEQLKTRFMGALLGVRLSVVLLEPYGDYFVQFRAS